jgi:hypothetical protein
MDSHTAETYGQTFVAEANSTGSETILTLPQGGSFAVRAVKFYSEIIGSEDLSVGSFVGESRLAPTNSSIALPANEVVLPCHRGLSPGDTVDVRWENQTSTARTITALVVGEEPVELEFADG